MHQLILQTGRDDGHIDNAAADVQNAGASLWRSVKPHALRMIANAAGGLLPSLAQELLDTFGANVRATPAMRIYVHVA